jgi:hypothetical protein
MKRVILFLIIFAVITTYGFSQKRLFVSENDFIKRDIIEIRQDLHLMTVITFGALSKTYDEMKDGIVQLNSNETREYILNKLPDFMRDNVYVKADNFNEFNYFEARMIFLFPNPDRARSIYDSWQSQMLSLLEDQPKDRKDPLKYLLSENSITVLQNIVDQDLLKYDLIYNEDEVIFSWEYMMQIN